MRTSIAIILTLLTLGGSAGADPADRAGFDWKPWRSLAVQDGGRAKPLDSLAREAWRSLGSPSSFTDPDSGQKLDATAAYLSMVLERLSGEEGSAAHAAAGHTGHAQTMPGRPGRMPVMIRPALRPAMGQIPLDRGQCGRTAQGLGMPENQKLISPFELGQSQFARSA